MRLWIFFALLPCAVFADACDPSAAAKATLAKLDIPRAADTTPLAHRQQQIAIVRQALAKNPQDLVLHTALQDLEIANKRRRELIAEYDAVGGYLAARANVSVNTAKAIRLLEASKLPQAHLLLAEIHATESFRDMAKVREHWQSFRTACPATPAWWRSLGWLPDATLRAEILADLRTVLTARKGDREAIGVWGWLWQFEMAATRSDQRQELTARIREDLAKLPKSASVPWADLAEQAARVLDDDGIRDVAWNDLAVSHPNSFYAPLVARQEFYKKHLKWGTPEAVKAAKEIADRWPADAQSVFHYWRVIAQWKEAPREQVQNAADRLKAQFERDPGAIPTSPPPQTALAEFTVERGLRLEDVPPLVFQSLALAEQEVAVPNDLYPKPAAGALSLKDVWYLLSYFPLAEAYIGMKRVSSAGDIVSQVKVMLDRTRPADTASGNEKFRHAEQEAMYWFLEARLRELSDHKEAAVEAFRRSLKTFPPRRPRPDRRDEVMASARKLWKSLGKDDAEWNEWAASTLVNFNAGAGGPNGWKVLAAKRPGFKFRDALGKEWDPAELASKTTLVAYWATWCLPCREELPYLEKLTARLKDRKDVAVMALNVDENPALMEPFLAKMGVKVHSVAARDFGYELAPVMALPSNWIMRPGKTEQFYVEVSGEAWLEKAVEALSK
jgi:thiol-disulfide isomerase/thioredoxin